MKRFLGGTGLLLLLSVIPVKAAGSLSAALDAATFYHNGTALASDGNNCIRAADQYSRAACRLCVCTDENQLQRTRQVPAFAVCLSCISIMLPRAKRMQCDLNALLWQRDLCRMRVESRRPMELPMAAKRHSPASKLRTVHGGARPRRAGCCFSIPTAITVQCGAGNDLNSSSAVDVDACVAACCANPLCAGALFEPQTDINYNECQKGLKIPDPPQQSIISGWLVGLRGTVLLPQVVCGNYKTKVNHRRQYSLQASLQRCRRNSPSDRQ